MPVTGEPTRTRRGARRPTRAGRRAWTASSASVWTAPRRATCNAGASDFGSTRAAASSTSPYTTTRPLEIRRTDDCGAQVACAHEMCLVTGVLLVKVALARSCTLLHALARSCTLCKPLQARLHAFSSSSIARTGIWALARFCLARVQDQFRPRARIVKSVILHACKRRRRILHAFRLQCRRGTGGGRFSAPLRETYIEIERFLFRGY